MVTAPSWFAAAAALCLSSSLAVAVNKNNAVSMQVTSLHRYAVKGLSGDVLDSVALRTSCFPDDRRYALLLQNNDGSLQQREWKEGEWFHKENFLCAFTHPELLAKYKSSYRIVENHYEEVDATTVQQRLLELKDRATGQLLVGPLHMETEHGRTALADFLSEHSGNTRTVVCVTSEAGDFQFGNTSAGVKNGDANARSIHVSIRI